MDHELLLSKRTKDALSSYISEDIFGRKFLSDDMLYSKGWWFSKADNAEYMFLHKNNLNALDTELINIFESESVPVFQIKTSDTGFYIKCMGTGAKMSFKEFLSTHKHMPKKENARNTANRKIKEQYLNYFMDANILEDVKESVELEDIFLNRFFSSANIDCFVKNAMGILVLEIKYKYRDRGGNFGINKMQYEMINMLQKFGLRAYNIILENIDRIDILQTIGEERLNWIYSRIEQDLTETKTAPSKTSYFENSEQRYYPVRGDQYRPLSVESNFINLSCPRCGGRLVLRRSLYGEFLGCQNYFREGCDGKITSI